jgi:two-component system response regulator GlrR
VQIRLPPLRERAQDLPLLVDEILADLGMTDHPLAATLRTKDFHDQLAAHAWTGNVRELRNYLERCIALRTPLPPNASTAVDPGPPVSGPEPLKTARDRALRVFEHSYLVDILGRHDGNVSAAARAAGIDRIHFYRLLWRNGLK